MYYCKKRLFSIIKWIYLLFTGAFTLFLMLCRPAYGGYSIFEFTFTNNTNHTIAITRGITTPDDDSHSNPPSLNRVILVPGQTSRKFIVGQRGFDDGGGLAMYYKWFISGYKNHHIFCSSVMIFQLVHLGSNALWRYGTIVRQNKVTHPVYPLCKEFKGAGAKKFYDDKSIQWNHAEKWGNKKLPPPCNRGYPRHYIINIPLGKKVD